MSWKQIETAEGIQIAENVTIHPVATFSDGYGTMHLCIDDHCFILRLKKPEGGYVHDYWWPPVVCQVAAKLMKDPKIKRRL